MKNMSKEMLKKIQINRPVSASTYSSAPPIGPFAVSNPHLHSRCCCCFLHQCLEKDSEKSIFKKYRRVAFPKFRKNHSFQIFFKSTNRRGQILRLPSFLKHFSMFSAFGVTRKVVIAVLRQVVAEIFFLILKNGSF